MYFNLTPKDPILLQETYMSSHWYISLIHLLVYCYTQSPLYCRSYLDMYLKLNLRSEFVY